jgi:hypothetical protein
MDTSTIIKPEPNKKNNKSNEQYDEPFLYYEIGSFSFATATLLLGIKILDGFKLQILLTVYGFFIGGLGQLITGIMCFKYNHYMDGTTNFFFALNWGINTVFDLMERYEGVPILGNRERGFHNLMCCFFTFSFFLQMLKDPSHLTKISFGATFLSFVFSTIGAFKGSKGMTKTAGVFCCITGVLAFYTTFASLVNTRYQKVYVPTLDGNEFGKKIGDENESENKLKILNESRKKLDITES